MPNQKVPTVLDLFCGAGGLTLGFQRAGFQCVGAMDWDNSAILTHLENFSSRASRIDLGAGNPNDLPHADVIVGGPPCQGFSSAGMRNSSDKRNDLVARFAQIVNALKPRAFVFENVEGFLTAADGRHVMALLRPLIASGYVIHARKVNAANFGVPQHRKRIIVIGGLGWEPSFPDATHTAFGAPGAALAGRSLPLSPTLDQALSGLPPAHARPPGDLQGHFFRALSGTDLLRAEALAPGQSMRDLPADLQHVSYQRRAFRRVRDGTPTERRGGAPTGIRRLKGDEPCKAITGGTRNEFLHPRENRPLTLRECARLQTFPDEFVFSGTLAQQAQLVGNAVPPLLAQAIAKSLFRDLIRLEPGRPKDSGMLLSFVATLSEGASPALKRVMESVRAEFDMKSDKHRKALS